jgi:hypothetical protein
LEEIVITDYNEDLDLDCPIILKYILKKWYFQCVGLVIFLRIQPGGWCFKIFVFVESVDF